MCYGFIRWSNPCTFQQRRNNMQHERISQFLAIFCGIIVGALTAQSIANAFEIGKYFWFIGALFGGVIAWSGVDVKKFYAGAKLASKHAWNQIVSWRLNVEYWKFVGRLYLFALSTGSTLGCLIAANTWHKSINQLNNHERLIFWVTFFPIEMFGVVSLSAFLAAITSTFVSPFSTESENFLMEKQKFLSDFLILYTNPIGLTILYLKGCVRLIRWMPSVPSLLRHILDRCVECVRVTSRFLRRFIQLAFLYTNHERRTASFVFAAIGASVGYVIGYIPIVAVIGAIAGVLEFELTKSIRERMSDDRVKT